MDFSVPGIPAVGFVFPSRNEVTCMKYHEGGRRLYAASSADDRLQVIDCVNGTVDQPSLKCEREHIHTLEPTHHEQCILFAGKGAPTQPVGQRHAVNYWSLYDNKILRKFRGHTDKVTNISMCPADDSFLTSSLDRTVRLWTAGVAGCVAEMKLPDETENDPLAVFDSTGLVFAVTALMKPDAGHYLHLYDARNYGAGAFAELKVSQFDLEAAIQTHLGVTPERAKELGQADWTSLEFNVSGNQILVGAQKGLCLLLDGFEGAIQKVLAPPMPTERSVAACFTPDDKTVVQGNEDGTLSCWNVDTGTITSTLAGHPGPVTCVVANPKYTQIASSCSQAALWIW